jgi:hypothetical protein
MLTCMTINDRWRAVTFDLHAPHADSNYTMMPAMLGVVCVIRIMVGPAKCTMH